MKNLAVSANGENLIGVIAANRLVRHSGWPAGLRSPHSFKPA